MKFYQDIAAAYKNALEEAFVNLLSNGENFYYASLTVDEGGATPIFSAWSKESFEKACTTLSADEDPIWIKWSYSESPYFNFDENSFLKAKEIWESKGSIDDFDYKGWKKEINKRINSLEKSFSDLDAKGFFFGKLKRNAIMINVETAPPTHEDTLRAERLNPPESIKDWLAEVAE